MRKDAKFSFGHAEVEVPVGELNEEVEVCYQAENYARRAGAQEELKTENINI